ncbi:MAG: hypothetical protein K2N87_10150 [Eubacterium sp.]|nr:hypothetical protein [Eubacterium sp.]
MSESYDIGAVKMHIETAFLSELDKDGISRRLEEKVKGRQPFTDEELMEYIILPLSYKEKEEKQQKIRELAELAKKIGDRMQQAFVLSGMLAFTDKVIDKETANKIREVIKMTKVERMIRKELRKEMREEMREEIKIEERRKTETEKKKYIINMINEGFPSETIIRIIPEYSYDAVEAIRKENGQGLEHHLETV